MKESDDMDFGMVPFKLLYDKSRTVKEDLGPNTSGISPSRLFRLKFKSLIPELNKLPGMFPDNLLASRLNVARTAISPRDTGMGPES